ncbi:MAG: hypothetical protein JXR14_10250 [Paracoccaceae bacterium]
MFIIFKDLRSCSVTSKRALRALFCGAVLIGASPALSDTTLARANSDGAGLPVITVSETVNPATSPSFLDDLRKTLERIAVLAGRPETGPTSVQHSPEPAQGALAAEMDGLDPSTMTPSRLQTAAPDSLLGRIAAYREAIVTQARALSLLGEAKGDSVRLSNAHDRGRTDRIIKAIGEMRDTDPTNRAGLEKLHTELAAAQAADRAYEIERNGIDYDITVLEMVTRDARQEQTDALVSASGGRKLSPQALAELHEWLDLAPPRRLGAQGLTDVSGQLPRDRDAIEG